MPQHDTEPVAPHTWKVGDVALCINDRPAIRPDQMVINPRVKCGQIYSVFELAVGLNGKQFLVLDGGEKYVAIRFIPVNPQPMNEDDVNIIAAMRLSALAARIKAQMQPPFGKYLPPPRNSGRKGGPNESA